MKKSILILSAVLLFACTKNNTTTPNLKTTSVTNQDSKLFGYWNQDSSKRDGSATAINSVMIQDSIFITSASWIEKVYSNGSLINGGTYQTWTTASDSVIVSGGNHYHYAITGNILELYLHCTSCAGYNVKYWYHK